MTKRKPNYRKSKPKGKAPVKFDPKSKDQVDTPNAEQKYNDPSWYYVKDQNLKDIASFSFNTALGSTVSIPSDGNTSGFPVNLHIPGIMSIYAGPAVSPSDAPTSPINIAARNVYSWVRHENSGHANYDATDLMLYLMAMDSVYAMISYMQRIIGFAQVFSQTNRYVGDMLLIANGVRPSEIRQNLANLRAFVNQYIVKATAFCVPDNLSIYKRHYWMFSNAWKDEPVSKSQFYMYVPAYLWQYSWDTEQKGCLDPLPVLVVPNATTGFAETRSISIAELYSLANALLDQLQYSEDCNIMSGDIRKAYGDEHLWNMNLLDEGYAVLPVYSEEILDQIHNTVFTGRTPIKGDRTCSYDSLQVTQVVRDLGVSPYLVFKPQFAHAHHLGYSKLVDMHSESPTPEEIMVATRNVLTGKPTGNGSDFELTSCGSDICMFGLIHYLLNGQPENSTIYYEDNANVSGEFREQMLAKFNKYPTFLWYNEAHPEIGATPQGVAGEVDNFTIISQDRIKAMHETALLSMLNVPNSGRVQ